MAVSREQLEAHSGPHLTLAERRSVRRQSQSQGGVQEGIQESMERRPAGEPEGLAAMLANLQSELAEVRKQNKELITKVGGRGDRGEIVGS